jgi:8-oxo-dGTP pyrophosphatase MutT (NUDIX family)
MEFGILRQIYTIMSKKIKPRIKAAGALFLSIKTKRFLFLMRADDTYTNTWATVGGKTEPGESVIESLGREIQEEIGFLPIVRKTIPVDLFISNDEKFEFHTFVCLVDNEFIPKLNDEHKGYAWSGIDSYPKPLHPALYNALQLPELRSKIENILDLLEISQANKLSKVHSFVIT